MLSFRFLALMSCCATLLHPTIAHAQRSEWGGPCSDYTSYLITPQGRCIDLTYVTSGMQQERQQANQAQENLVNIILYGTPEEYEPYLTDQITYEGIGALVYSDRYIQTVLQYPNTEFPENEFETTLRDCQTGDFWSTAFTFDGQYQELRQAYAETSQITRLITTGMCSSAGL